MKTIHLLVMKFFDYIEDKNKILGSIFIIIPTLAFLSTVAYDIGFLLTLKILGILGLVIGLAIMFILGLLILIDF